MDKNTKNEKMENDSSRRDTSGTSRVRHTRRPIGNPEMMIDRKCDRDYDENTITYGVTEIDEKFDLTFGGSYSFMLNKKQFWDDLIEALKQHPCYKRMSTCGTDVFDKYVFKVPIKEQKTIAYCQEEFREEHWVKYNGEYYDPSKIYVVEYEDNAECDDKEIRNNIRSIRAVCDQKLPRPFVGNTKIEFIGLCECQYSSVQRNLITQYALSNCFTKTNELLINKSYARYSCSNNSYPERIDTNPGEIVFDMKNLSNITHLGMLPPPIRTQKARLRNSKDAYLTAASNLSKQSWVSNFKVWYKINGSDNWVYLNEYKGNDNCYSMNLIDLSSEYNTNDGLQCRYLKVVVSSYHINPGFRLAVYGKQNQQETVAEKKDQYIEYAIEFPVNNTKKVPDGKIRNYHCRYWGNGEYPNRTKAKMAFMTQLKHGEFDEVVDGDLSDGYDYNDDDNESVCSWNSYWTCSGCGGGHQNDYAESVRSELSDDDYDVINNNTVEYPGALRQFMDATNHFWYG